MTHDKDKAFRDAREFWIAEGSDLFGYPTLDCYSIKIHDDDIHVIDKQAYDDLLAQADKLSEALSNFVHTDENGVRKSSPQWECEALANWQKFRSGI